MSQRALEAALGKLVCDGGFRSEFFRDPEDAITRAEFDLTSVELSCLFKIGLKAIEAFEMHVDDRVLRAAGPKRAPKARGKAVTG